MRTVIEAAILTRPFDGKDVPILRTPIILSDTFKHHVISAFRLLTEIYETHEKTLTSVATKP